MAASHKVSRSTWPALLAAASIGSEAVAWGWVLGTQDGGVWPGPPWVIALGLAGLLGMTLSAMWLWMSLRTSRRSLRRAHAHAARSARAQQTEDAARREAVRERAILASSLNTLDVGLEIYDEQDRLIMYNKRINLMHPGLHTPEDLGKRFDPLVRANIERGLITAAIGREEAWLAERLATRGTLAEPLLQELAGDQWINTYETRTPEGYLVAVRVDVTDLVRKGRALEESNNQLALQSITDSLTGIGNRRLFDQALATEWQRAARTDTPMSLLLVDIDHFKAFNDRHGHLAGDDALRRVAMALSDCVRRAGELVARYGGEEFVMLLPGADEARALITARQVMDRVGQEAIVHAASPTGSLLTCSIGVATVQPTVNQGTDTLVNAADAAMYRAKTGGRARFEVAQDRDWPRQADPPRTRPTPLTVL